MIVGPHTPFVFADAARVHALSHLGHDPADVLAGDGLSACASSDAEYAPGALQSTRAVGVKISNRLTARRYKPGRVFWFFQHAGTFRFHGRLTGLSHSEQVQDCMLISQGKLNAIAWSAMNRLPANSRSSSAPKRGIRTSIG
jgi:hypothetical protein